MEIEIFLKILLSAVLGGIIGLDWEISQKGVGLRTNILIAIGSTLFTILSFKVAELSNGSDPTRLVVQIVIGVGLLGAGAIIRSRFIIQGLNAAASIWITAAIGVSVGIGYYLPSFIVTIFTVLIFVGLNYISSLLESQDQLNVYVIFTEERASILIEVKKIIRELGLKYLDARMKKVEGGYELEIALNTSKTKNQGFIEKVMQLSGVKEIVSEHF